MRAFPILLEVQAAELFLYVSHKITFAFYFVIFLFYFSILASNWSALLYNIKKVYVINTLRVPLNILRDRDHE